MNNHYQLVIIGGGAAGLSAAVTAANYDLRIALIDEQAAIGGQIYRGIESVPKQRGKQLGDDYLHGKSLATAFHRSDVDYFSSTQVWSVNKQGEIGIVNNNQAQILTADQIIIATGAMERPVPFPGWTLTGVMNAGAGQVLFKSAGVVPKNEMVLAGSGPLLLLLATQYLHAGIKIKALLDMSTLTNHLYALPKLPQALLAAHYLIKGMKLQQELKQAGIPILEGVSGLKALGDDNKINSISFKHNRKQKTFTTDLLLIHFGVIPHIWLTQSVGCHHRWDDSQQCWQPKHDQWGKTNLDGILIAGDGSSINGAKAAEYSGKISALQAVYALGKINKQQRHQLTLPAKKSKQQERCIRPFLERWFAISDALLITADDETLVCRCEEITAGEIRQAVHEGHHDSNQIKFINRCGMGACQGRQCANAVANIVAAETGKTIHEAGIYRGRPPVTPITLGQLANLYPQEKQ